MKKILSFIVIAIGVMFGLASCSGDLHDNENVQQVMGLNGWSTSLTLKNGRAEFLSNQTDHDLAILADGVWSGPVIRGSSVHAGELPEGVSLSNNVGVPTGPNAGNLKLTGLKTSTYYTIEVDIRDESNAYISLYEK